MSEWGVTPAGIVCPVTVGTQDMVRDIKQDMVCCPTLSKTQKNQKIKLCVHFSRASILHHCICLDMHDHGVQIGGWCSVFPGSICVSGFATPVVNCGTARVPMGLPM